MEETTTNTNETPETETEDKETTDSGADGGTIGEETGKEEEPEEVKEKEAEEPDEDVEDIEPETRSEEEKTEEKTKEDELDPDDRVVIEKEVEKRVGPLEKKLQEQTDTVEVNAFIADNPDFAKYKAAMIKYISHSAYSNIPVANIARIVAGKDLMKMGAKQEREAQKKAADSKSAGSNVRPSKGGVVDWTKASDEEVEAETAKVLGHEV